MVHFQNAQSLQWATARLTAVKGGGGADNEFVQSAIAQIDDIEVFVRYEQVHTDSYVGR